MATITSSNPTAVRAPTGYTHGLLLQGVERRLIVSGQVGVAPDGSVPSTGEGQIAQAFANLRAVLEDAGTGLHRVVKVTCFVADADAFSKLNELFTEFFPGSPPVRSTPVVALPKGLLFSIDAIAAVD